MAKETPVDPDLAALLPEDLRARLASLTTRGDTATVVVEAAGLAMRDRAALEEAARAAVLASPRIERVQVALMGEATATRTIAIGSGKGGVGKSTLTANLAVALARAGRRVGVIDADIYGPSQAKLLGVEGRKAEAEDKRLIPLDSPHGVRVLSMANLVEPGRAIAWRGPMAAGALGQLVEAHWDAEELLLIDLPPGTGDVQLTMLQRHKPDGAVIVSTPQDLALIDAMRAGQLLDQGEVPVLGLVENMAGYICPHCGELSDPFGAGAVEAAAARLDLPFLGRVPLTVALREASDRGQVLDRTPEASAFAAIAHAMIAGLERP